MAEQDSLLKFKGRIGDLTFMKTKNGYQARRRSGVSAERILNDPAFQRTRENGLEFATGGKSAKMLRVALRPLLLQVKDGRMTNRLSREMMRVIKADTTSLRGQRNPIAGELGLLQGFEFNANGLLTNTVFTTFAASVDRAAGTAQVVIPSFIPDQSITRPEGATHLKFISGVALVDFTTGDHQFVETASPEIAIGGQPEPDVTLSSVIPPGSALPIFQVFGIAFTQEVNGTHYPLRNGAYNALSLVTVDRVV